MTQAGAAGREDGSGRAAECCAKCAVRGCAGGAARVRAGARLRSVERGLGEEEKVVLGVAPEVPGKHPQGKGREVARMHASDVERRAGKRGRVGWGRGDPAVSMGRIRNTRTHLKMHCCQYLSMWSQFSTCPCRIGQCTVYDDELASACEGERRFISVFREMGGDSLQHQCFHCTAE